ncbi:MAG: hypothetical protein ACO1OR_11190 [Hydrogenophaga sp.]|jgi:hypothetical protein|uniref:hypothetical protein n=1 Tax=Hydrogenophaga intermedia TaxID=65786 RepID=UPI00204427A1|nr:hypothetical protein [Hydrogenophaga intermedia]MCM3563839.1 hypothetical protein [Hydrogenophaga intermedia]
MSVCFNCRKPVSLSAESCPYCGIGYTRGTLRSPLSGIAPSESGWGFASGVLKNRLYQWAALLLPFWGPVVVGALGGNAPITGLFFSPFLLIPGLHLIGNRPAWRGMTRLAVCLAYAAACVSLWIVILMSLRV